jgi:hypothetical protein
VPRGSFTFHLFAALLTEVAAERLPPRRDRHNPRVVKRKMSNYRLKRAADLRPTPTTPHPRRHPHPGGR